MANDSAKKLFQKYVNAASDLAESVKRNIVHDGVVDDKTVNLLNDFIIATNELANLEVDEVELNSEQNDFNEENESDPTLN